MAIQSTSGPGAGSGLPPGSGRVVSPAPGRLLSLDALRGSTIAVMVLVNDPAMGPPYLYHQLTHAAWNGWTLADTVYPAFMFMIGVALAFSMARYLDGRGTKAEAWPRISRRVGLLFGLGLLVNGFPLLVGSGGSVIGHLRIPGVLQRIAVAYLLASLVVLYLRPRYQAVLAAFILLGYWAALRWVPVPGFGAGALTPHGNLAGWVDRSVFGRSHLYGLGRYGYDPEGLLGSVVAATGILGGYWAGRALRRPGRRGVRALALSIAALACVSIGQAWSGLVPVNKRMWTPSYVLVMTGLSLGALAACHLLFDGAGRAARWSSLPLRILGTNAIVIYVGSELTASALAAYHHAVGPTAGAPIPFWLWSRYLVPSFGAQGGAVAYAASILIAWWLVLAVMYRRGLVLRV